MTWSYEQGSGRLLRDGSKVATGYSGAPEGRNDPLKQGVVDVGPIPRGRWAIGAPYFSQTHGPYTLPLTPQPGTETFGRGGFLVHGDSLEHPGNASRGCLILPLAVRQQMWREGDHSLEVVEGLSVVREVA